jgi:pimeloyl-ACP methyl ester carboxylesterase
MSSRVVARAVGCALLLLASASTGASAETKRASNSSNTLVLSPGVSIHYETAGKGRIPIVFVPGWTMSSAVFERQLEHFAGSTRFRFVSYDPRGQGRSSKPAEGHTYDQHGRDLHDVLDRLKLRRVVLVGWSFGVLDVTSYLQQFGSHDVRAVVLIDGTPKTAGTDSTTEWVWVGNDNWFNSMHWYSTDFAQWMLEDPTPEQVRWATRISLQTPDWIAALTNATGTTADYEAALEALEGEKPLLYVMGTEHWHTAVEQWAAAHTPSAKLVSLGRHLMFWQRAREFNAVLDEFLKQLK